MDGEIIMAINWLRGLTIADWLLAGCFTLLGLSLWELAIAPALAGLHRRTWL